MFVIVHREFWMQKPISGDTDSEKVLRRRKIQPLYHELDDSLCSSLTDLPTGGKNTATSTSAPIIVHV